MAEKSTTFVSLARIDKLFSQDGPYMLSGTVGSKALNGPISTQHIMNLPNRIKQKDPSDGVFIRALRTKTEEPQDVLPVLEPRGNIGNRLVKEMTTRKVL